LIGPTQLTVPADVPREERLLSDALYARQRSTARDPRYLLLGLGALFTKFFYKRILECSIAAC
jgi:hypothetical protein